MSRLIKVLFGSLVALMVMIPALLLVVVIVWLSLLLAGGAAVVSLSRSLSLLAAVLLVGAGLAAALLASGWFIHLRRATLHYLDHGQKCCLTVAINLTGRQLYRQLLTATKIRHQHGGSWMNAFELALDDLLHDEVRDYILHQVGEQYGVDVAAAMTLADDQAFHFSL